MSLRVSSLLSTICILVCLIWLPTVTTAQDYDPNGPIEPELLANAEAGDAYANYLAAFKYFQLRDAASLEAALQHAMFADAAYANEGPEFDQLRAGVKRLIGDIYQDQSRFAKAIAVYADVITLSEQAGDWLNKGQTEQAIGMALQGLSRYPASIDYFERARNTFTGAEGPESVHNSDTYLNIGISFEGMKEYKKSLAAYAEAARRYKVIFGEDSAQVGYTINNAGWVMRRMENYAGAQAAFEETLPILDRHEGRFSPNAGKVRINLGIVAYFQGNHDEAIRWTMGAMPYIRENRATTLSDQRWAFDTLARSFRAKGDPQKAILFAKLSVNAHQAVRSANSELAVVETEELNTEWRWIYQNLADLLIEQGRITEAQAVLNMEKEQEVFEFLKRDGSAKLNDTRALLSDAELSEEEKIEQIATMPVAAARELDDLMRKLDAGTLTAEEEDRIFILQDAVQTAIDSFDEDVEQMIAALDIKAAENLEEQVSAVGAYQSVLQGMEQSTAILQIAAMDDQTHLFLTLPHLTIHQTSNIAKVDLSRLVFDALQAIEHQAPDAQDRLQALNDVLLAPVEDALTDSGTEVVMLNLDGFLRYIPFAALFDGEAYAIEKFAFALYSSAVPTQFARGGRQSSKTAGFGVTVAHPGFTALPGVRRELETIFVGEDTEGVLEGPTGFDEGFDQKKLKRALLRKPGILHIASHFNLVPGREDDSFLLLGDGSHLPLSEIRRQKALSFQGVDLLTLSACQTARGGGDGSEIEGFAATAQLNGASSVMASLWPVSDDATPQLMQSFYDKMIREDLTKAEALRQAQIEMLHGGESSDRNTTRAAESLDDTPQDLAFAHPYFWSAFVLMGNWL